MIIMLLRCNLIKERKKVSKARVFFTLAAWFDGLDDAFLGLYTIMLMLQSASYKDLFL